MIPSAYVSIFGPLEKTHWWKRGEGGIDEKGTALVVVESDRRWAKNASDV